MFIHFTTQYGGNIIYNADKIRHIYQIDSRIYIHSKNNEDKYDFDNEEAAQNAYNFILAQLKEA